MNAPGKYNDECTRVRESLKANAVILIVVAGQEGHGFSVQAPPPVMSILPTMLRVMADQIEHDNGCTS